MNEKNDVNLNDNENNDNNVTEKDIPLERIAVSEQVSERRMKRKKRFARRRRIKNIKIILLVLIIVSAVTAAVTYFVFKNNYLDSIELLKDCLEETAFKNETYVDGKKAACLFEPIFQNESVYVPISFIDSAFVYNAVYDYQNDILSIASDFERIKASKDNDFCFVNGQKTEFGKKVFLLDNGRVYILSDLIEKFYNIEIKSSPKYKSLCMDSTLGERKTAVISTEQELVGADNDRLVIVDSSGNEIVPKVFKGDYVSLYEEIGGLSEIRTSDGAVGFVDSDSVTEKIVKEPLQKVRIAESIPICSDGKGVVLFEQISNADANKTFIGKEIPVGVDILIPTWFSFKESESGTDGTILSLADKKYVDYAHSKGRKVWGLVTDNFKSNVSRSVVNSAPVREKVISQIVAAVQNCGLDGVNIDFESIPADAMRGFTQFLRELSACLNSMNVSLSIDVYTPHPWSSYYNRKEFSDIVDYFIVMGYDEHTESSDESGSVATKSWSEQSITLTEHEGVSKEKLILGIPFYTRIWKETNSGLETRAYGMAEGYKIMTDKGARFKWIDNIGQNYAEINSGGALYKMWLEDEKSVEERVKLVNKYNIAGVAAWRRGLEKNEVWPVIKKYMKG